MVTQRELNNRLAKKIAMKKENQDYEEELKKGCGIVYNEGSEAELKCGKEYDKEIWLCSECEAKDNQICECGFTKEAHEEFKKDPLEYHGLKKPCKKFIPKDWFWNRKYVEKKELKKLEGKE